MLEAYRRILEKRRGQMMDQVRWTRELTAGLEKNGLMSREELKEIEMELNPRNRIYAMLSKIMAREEVGIFNRFRQLLVDVGDSAMADSLLFDRSRIKWEFERDARVTSLPHYIQLLNTELLQASLTEHDEYIRQCMFHEAKQRLEDLRISLRNQQQDRDNFRSQVWWAVTTKKTSFGELVGSVRDFVNLSEIDDSESKKDEQLLGEVKTSVACLQGRVTKLTEENRLLRDELHRQGIATDFLKADSSADEDADERHGSDNSDQDVFLSDSPDLERRSQKNVINERRSSTDKLKSVCICRSDFEQLIQAANSALASGSQSVSKSSTSNLESGADDLSLIEVVRAVLTELEKWKVRSHQLRQDVFRLEAEREKIAREFGLPSLDGDRETFAQCVLHRMAEAVKECETLRYERRILAERCGELNEFDANASSAAVRIMFNRLRRISADRSMSPVATNGQVTEVIVATQTLSNGNDGGRKPAHTSSTSAHGVQPLPPLGPQHQTSRTAPSHDQVHDDTSKHESVPKSTASHDVGKLRRATSTKTCNGVHGATSSKTTGRAVRRLSLVGTHPQMTR